MKMVLLPPGEFRMGLSEQDTWDRLCSNMRKSSNKLENEQPEHGGLLTEMPAHQVRLNKPFYMGECEVTVAQFRQFADATGYQTSVSNPEPQPAINAAKINRVEWGVLRFIQVLVG